MDCRPPSSATIMNGTPSQMLATIAVNSAVQRWSNQATGSRPTLAQGALMRPNRSG